MTLKDLKTGQFVVYANEVAFFAMEKLTRNDGSEEKVKVWYTQKDWLKVLRINFQEKLVFLETRARGCDGFKDHNICCVTEQDLSKKNRLLHRHSIQNIGPIDRSLKHIYEGAWIRPHDFYPDGFKLQCDDPVKPKMYRITDDAFVHSVREFYFTIKFWATVKDDVPKPVFIQVHKINTHLFTASGGEGFAAKKQQLATRNK